MHPQTIEILIPGTPSGYKYIHLTGWEGKCFIIPRTELKSFDIRPETQDPGVYFLFGDNDDSTNQKLYIGESENFYKRLMDHDAKKDFWNFAIIFTGGIDKANIKHLEHLATSLAKTVGRYSLVNVQEPPKNKLSEFKTVTTENYFNNMTYVLDVLGYPIFTDIKKDSYLKETYFLNKQGAKAESQLLSGGGLNVLAGSLARIKETEAFTGWALSARKLFIEDGTFIKDEDGVSYRLTKDVFFKTPSAAAATLTGSPINGWTAWKDKKGKTLDENLR